MVKTKFFPYIKYKKLNVIHTHNGEIVDKEHTPLVESINSNLLLVNINKRLLAWPDKTAFAEKLNESTHRGIESSPWEIIENKLVNRAVKTTDYCKA